MTYQVFKTAILYNEYDLYIRLIQPVSRLHRGRHDKAKSDDRVLLFEWEP